tara:strand:+ start:6708 stop:7022 length:315 start_codon:yes stop_codon:yes gene_type:complete
MQKKLKKMQKKAFLPCNCHSKNGIIHLVQTTKGVLKIMTLQEIIQQLQELASEHGENIEVDFVVPKTTESGTIFSVRRNEISESKVKVESWKGEPVNKLELFLQ